jgi:hypothetical protein
VKRVIEGKTYNTETAAKVAYRAKKNDGDRHVTMYLTRKGEFFFHVQMYERAVGHLQNHWFDPKKFIEDADEVYLNPFSSLPDDQQRESSVLVRFPLSLKVAIEAAAEAQGQSTNAWVVRCLESCLCAASACLPGREVTMPKEMLTMENEKVIEQRLRRKAQRLGYRVEKSRARNLHSNDQGGYQLIDDRNTVRGGVNYELDLAALSRILDALENKAR